MQTGQDWARFLANVDEFEAVKELLDAGEDRLGDLQYISRDSHVLNAVLASGVEKLLKLTYGYVHLNDTGMWPGESIVAWGHRVLDLDTECRRLIAGRASSRARHENWIRTVGVELDGDAFIRPLLSLLQNYGSGGRFANLDLLAESPPRFLSPRLQWQELDQQVADVHGVDLDVERAVRRRADVLRRSLRRWRYFYHQAWVQNVVGDQAQRYAFEMGGTQQP